MWVYKWRWSWRHLGEKICIIFTLLLRPVHCLQSLTRLICSKNATGLSGYILKVICKLLLIACSLPFSLSVIGFASLCQEIWSTSLCMFYSKSQCIQLSICLGKCACDCTFAAQSYPNNSQPIQPHNLNVFCILQWGQISAFLMG